MIVSCLWSIRGQMHDWRHHYKGFPCFKMVQSFENLDNILWDWEKYKIQKCLVQALNRYMYVIFRKWLRKILASSVDQNCKFSKRNFSTPAIFKATSKLLDSQGCSVDYNWLDFSSISKICRFHNFQFHSTKRDHLIQAWQWHDFHRPITILCYA